MKISIVTWNAWKYQQICDALPEGIQTVQVALDIPETQTNLLTDISYDKCLQAYVEMQWPVLVDDSGIFFDAYEQFPGALSKYVYQGIWLEGIAKLFAWDVSRRARFQSVVSYMDETMMEPEQFVEETAGDILLEEIERLLEKTLPWLPYDAIFKPDYMDCIAAEDLKTYKWEQHHRYKAVRKFGEWFEGRE